MKASKAPEKIYIDVNEDLGKVYAAFTEAGGNDIEYIRKDVFIEKACEYWYKYNRDIVNKQCCKFTVNVEDFKKYLRGE